MRIDWVKVACALDDEWARHRELAQRALTIESRGAHNQLADLAFMLRDVLTAGMSSTDREQVLTREAGR